MLEQAVCPTATFFRRTVKESSRIEGIKRLLLSNLKVIPNAFIPKEKLLRKF